MKQNKFGKKVINWHRPLGRSQLRQRYLALRHDDAEHTKRGQIIGDWNKPIEVDEYWNIYDPLSDHLYQTFDHWDFECSSELKSFSEQDGLSFLWQQFTTYELSKMASVFKELKPASSSLKEEHSKELNQHDSLEQDLVYHLMKLPDDLRMHQGLDDLAVQSAFNHATNNKGYSKKNETIEGIIANVATSKDRKALTQFASIDDKSTMLAKQIMLFAPFWVRRPSDWQGENGHDFLKHIFVLYDAPNFLYSAIFRNYISDQFKWLCWLILLGQGGSLKRVAPLFHWNIKGRFPHYLQSVPNDLSATEACIYAEVRNLGGDDRDFNRILDGRTLVVDPTEKPAYNDTQYPLFWQTSVQWLIRHSNDISDDECSAIMQWALHKYTEGQRLEQQAFSWKGRTVHSTLEKVNEYQQSISQPYSQYKWNRHNWDWSFTDANEDKWLFNELTSGKALYIEGNALGHCVARYASRCASGFSAIVSVKLNNRHCITAELEPSTKNIVQLRGKYNRSATGEEQRIVAKWMHTVVNKIAENDIDKE